MRTPRVLVLAIPILGGPAEAGRHIIARGETIERVAAHYGCTAEAVLRANQLTTTIVPPGTVIHIPPCPRAGRPAGAIRARAAVREPTRRRRGDPTAAAPTPASSQSLGRPWDGRLHDGARLPPGEGYRVRRPHRAFGASHVVEHLRGAIATVRALHPHVHELAIGDLSAPEGGPLGDHQSHQSGLDVDVGLYFRTPPAGYPESFAAAGDDLDLAATWALVTAFARTSHLDDGVEVIFLDRAVQARLHRFARARGTPDDQLADLLQYPRDPDAASGLVRHWPHHADHLHVRFKPGRPAR